MKKRFKKIEKNRKGSHVGVMISFMIFVAFVLFISVILEPALKTNPDKKSLLESVEKKIIDATSSEMVTAALSIDSTSTCVSIGSFISNFDAYDGNIIKNQNKALISSSLSSADFDTLYIKRNSNSEDFVKIYSSDSLPESDYETISCSSITEGTGYEATTKRDSYVFLDKIIDLIDDYESYGNFKSNLNLPNNTDVGFSFEFENGSIISTNETQPTTNIFVREKSIEYVDENANILSGKLKTRVW